MIANFHTASVLSASVEVDSVQLWRNNNGGSIEYRSVEDDSFSLVDTLHAHEDQLINQSIKHCRWLK